MGFRNWRLGRATFGLAMTASLALAGPARAEDPLDANIAGQTSVGSGAGRIEARLLTGLTVKAAARRIVDDIGIDHSSLAVVVLPLPTTGDEDDVIGVAGWDTVPDAQSLPVVDDMVFVRDRLERFRLRHAELAVAVRAQCSRFQIESMGEKGVPSFLPRATSVLQAAAPLLNLFRQDFTYSGVGVGLRDGMLVTAIRAELVARRKPESSPSAGGAVTMAGAVDAVAGLIAEPVRCPGGGEAETAGLQELAQEFSAFRESLAGPATAPGMSLLDAAEDQLRRYGPRPGTLVLAIDAVGASMVERRNLATMFGAEAATVSTGLVVSYEYYEPQSAGLRALRAAGVLSCMSGAEGIRKLHTASKIASRARCF